MGNQKTLTPEPEDKDVGVPAPSRKTSRRLESYKKSFRDLGIGGRREVFPFGQAGGDAAQAQGTPRGEHNCSPTIRATYYKGYETRGPLISRSLRVGGSGREENLIADFNQDGNTYLKEHSSSLRNPKASQSNLLVTRTISQRYYKDGSENLIKVGTLGEDSQANRVYSPDGNSPTIPTSGGGRHIPQIVRPVLTPDRVKKRQNGRRFKEDGEPMFTLTGQDVHGVAIKTVGNIYGKGENGQVYDPKGICRTLKSGETDNPKSGGIGSSNSPKILSHSPRTNDPKLGGSGPLVSGEHCFTVDSTPHMIIEKDEHDIAIYNHPRNIDRKYLFQEDEVLSALRTVQRPPSKVLEKSTKTPNLSLDMRIRRLTPCECEKLMAFPPNWTARGIDRDGKEVAISDTQRYKLCGNSVVTSVIMAIGKRLLQSFK